MGDLTLILGGARGGKSSYAQQLAAGRAGQVLYVATAQALDSEMEARITAHKSDRPEGWGTLEAPHGVAQAVQAWAHPADLVVLDCLTMLVSNLVLEAAGDENQPDEAAAGLAVEAEMQALLPAIRASQADWIVVSNEVGMGLVPAYPLGRLYRDLLGKANRQFAQAAGEVFLLVAGIPVPIHQFRI